MHCTPPKAQTFRSAIINAGYAVSGSHANPLAVKTNAPPNVVWDIVRCWVKDHPVKIDAESYGGKLLAKEPELQANFSRAAGSVSKSQAAGVTRFVQNPAFWGPKARHGRPVKGSDQVQRLAMQQQGSDEQGLDDFDEAAAGSSGASQEQLEDATAEQDGANDMDAERLLDAMYNTAGRTDWHS